MINKLVILLSAGLLAAGCNTPKHSIRQANRDMPGTFPNGSTDTNSIADKKWADYFNDPNLIALIDTALKNNQEYNIVAQEIRISKNEVRARKGEYLPRADIGVKSEVDRAGRYTRFGALEHELEIEPGRAFPEPLGDHFIGASASWEVDIWKKLRNAKKSATMRYLASIEGQHLLATQLVSEIAESYYELMALDNLMQIVEKNIQIQSNALKIVRQQKEYAKVNQLAINRFQAQLLNTQNLQYEIRQRITETENRINFLTGRYPQPIERSSDQFLSIDLDSLSAGIPVQLLDRRPDIRQAEFELQAANLDVKVARAQFYPNLSIRSDLGLQAFNPTFLVNPESIIYNLAGDMMAPVVNRNAIMAAYNSASAKQIQAVYNYEQTLLKAYIDVMNQMAKMDNFSKSFELKDQEVRVLLESVTISGNLYNSARADYMEVLLTQREALESKIELIEVRMKQLGAKVNIYRALGGGWQ